MAPIRKDKYVARLANEWHQHGRIVLAVDYDSTLYPWHTIENQEDINKCIKLVRGAQETGAYVVIFTASNTDRHNEIREYCNSIGIRVDAINENPIKLPYGHEGKIYYNINLCDRSGLIEAMDILENAMYLQRAHLSADRHSYDGAIGF